MGLLSLFGIGNSDPNAGLKKELESLEKEVPILKETAKLMSKIGPLTKAKYAAMSSIEEDKTTCIVAKNSYRVVLANQLVPRERSELAAQYAEKKASVGLGIIKESYRKKFADLKQLEKEKVGAKFLGIF